VQTAVSSTRGLLQNGNCALLSPSILSDLLLAVVSTPTHETDKNSALEAAWGIIVAALSGRPSGEADSFLQSTTRMVLQSVLRIAAFDRDAVGSFSSHRAAMAQCLVHFARVDQPGLKAEVASMTPEDQQVVQQLIREHMAATAASGAAASEQSGQTEPAASKIALKLKF